LIQLDTQGEVAGVRFNNRSAAPFAFAPDLIEPYYRAYQRFARLLDDQRFQVRFKLAPGDLFIVDNTRVLHGRTGFASAGERHLQGCYADRDSLYSRLAVLSRQLTS
jgi:gamma-butyrobetaine dioxygenase